MQTKMNSSQVAHQREAKDRNDDMNNIIMNTDWLNVARTYDTLRETDICTADDAETVANKCDNFCQDDNNDDNGNRMDAHSGRESPYDNVICPVSFSHKHHLMKADCGEEQNLAVSTEESLDKLSNSIYDDDSNDLLFEELTNEVVSALTEGLDYNRWSRENLIEASSQTVKESKSSVDCFPVSSFNKFPVEDDMSSYEGNVRRVERLRTNVDREKALQWAQRLDSLISESSCRFKHPIWGSSVDGEEFSNIMQEEVSENDQKQQKKERKKKRHKCVSAWYGEGEVASVEDVTKSQDRISHASLDLLTNLASNFPTESELDINSKGVQTEYPTVSYKTGTFCDTIEEAQDVLATRYILPEITVKKAIITWSRWNIQDLIRSPSNQSDVWNPDLEPRLQLSQILLEMRDINEEIERREEVISRLLKAKTESKNILNDSIEFEDFVQERTAEVLQCPLISDNSKNKPPSRKQYSPMEDRSETDARNKSLAPPTTLVNTSVQFVHRWIRFIIRSLSRNRRNGSRR